MKNYSDSTGRNTLDRNILMPLQDYILKTLDLLNLLDLDRNYQMYNVLEVFSPLK